MIYRFKSSEKPYKPVPNSKWEIISDINSKHKSINWVHERFGGAWSCGGLDIGDMEPPLIRINKKARF